MTRLCNTVYQKISHRTGDPAKIRKLFFIITYFIFLIFPRNFAKKYYTVAKEKLRKFAELSTFPNVFQNFTWPEVNLQNHKGETLDMKGKWRSEYFKNDQPLIVELACGRGDYTLNMAKIYPNHNFIGVDIKGNRIWSGAKQAIEEKLNNVAFIRTRIEILDHYFEPNEISEIWITFPDPFPTTRRRRNRLTYTRFLELYRSLLVNDGVVHLKTDSVLLYEYTLEMLKKNNCTTLIDIFDIYKNGYDEPLLDIKTKYEKMHIADGRTIQYLKFRL